MTTIETQDKSHIELTIVNHFYFNQQDTSTLDDLLKEYASYSPELLDYIQFVLVDDCSPIEPVIDKSLNLNIRYLRITDDIKWNQPGARNLAAVYAASDKIVVTDLDLKLPEKTLRHLITVKNPGKTFYKFPRFDSNGNKIHSHPNTFFFSRARFFRFHGYDEDFSGDYGYDDVFFYRWQRYNGTRFLTFKDEYRVIAPAVERDASYHSLVRDLSHNEAIYNNKINLIKKYGPAKGHSRKCLNFNWQTIENRIRDCEIPEPVKRPNWSKNWSLRWLLPY
ncbi:MAG: glycosyltransferase family 2 protein [Gammaproteobacteria bacterium]|nr:glycosyltransferase family 2 protein [Gammaproteobacteria bacterium]